MKKKRLLAWLLACTLGIGMLSGCGSKSEESDAANDSGEAPKDVPVVTIKTRLDNYGYFESKVKEFNDTDDDCR